MFYPFDSRDSNYKSKFGAVAAGESLRLRALMPRSLSCSALYFVVRKDDWYREQFQSMFWAGMCGEDHEWWDITFEANEEGIYWYRFEYDSLWGRGRIYRGPKGKGQINEGGASWQQTVYKPEFQTPDWIKGGIMYQIFPDRFFNSKTPKVNVYKDRIIRDDWGGVPEYMPNEEGKILNNDYFGGDLRGIAENLIRLSSLGVTCIYLTPIFEAHSNHRYDTADYTKIDPLLGAKEDLRYLCSEAKRLGMNVILDGVFSHTGDDSVYFNKKRRYRSIGAYNSKDSPYYKWYNFHNYPEKYSAWWGIETLPEVDEESPQFLRFITGKNGVLRSWIKEGIKGWRLDVADELPDIFLDKLREAIKEEDKDAIIIGEVWEDASNKSSYGKRRRYLLGDQLDSVMNYPFSAAIMDFLKGGAAQVFIESILTVLENYPMPVVHALMNHIGTHDTKRALTSLAGEPANGRGREWQAQQKMTNKQRLRGVKLLKLASALQFFLPGIPSIYYGDEVGMEGYRDPFNRGCYPWGDEDQEILAWYKFIGGVRSSCPALKEGEFEPVYANDAALAFIRKDDSGNQILCAVNRGNRNFTIKLTDEWSQGKMIHGDIEKLPEATIRPLDCVILGIGSWADKLY